MKYFVSFAYGEVGNISVGNTQVEMDNVVATYGDISKMERKLEKLTGISHPIVLNYKPMEQATFECTRCGDSERLVATGRNILFSPQIKVGGNTEFSGKAAEEIAQALKKFLINSIEE